MKTLSVDDSHRTNDQDCSESLSDATDPEQETFFVILYI